jgi:hypothetical protein
MFVKISDQYYNMNNLKYFEFDSSMLSLYFLGTLVSQIQQSIEDYNSFLNFMNKNRLAFVENNLGINLKTVTNFNISENDNSFFFIDNSYKNFNVSAKTLEKFISEE